MDVFLLHIYIESMYDKSAVREILIFFSLNLTLELLFVSSYNFYLKQKQKTQKKKTK